MYRSTEYSRQKRIPGRSDAPYSWRDQTRSFRGAEVRRRAGLTREDARLREYRALRRRRTQILGEALKYLTLVVVVFVLFMEIGKLSEISSQSKRIDTLKDACRQLSHEAEAYGIQIEGYKSYLHVESSARELGMIYPDDGSTHMIQLARWEAVASGQLADNTAKD